jgi:FkbM family methyltransferase
MAPSTYQVRALARRPRAALLRRRYRDMDPLGRAMLEASDYRPAMLSFMRAVEARPDLLHEADLPAGSTVLDVGAYHGEWCEPVADRYEVTIHAFEPNTRARRVFAERLGERPDVHLHPYGLGGADATATLGLAGPGSTFHGHEAPFGTEVVEIRDVVGVLDELGLDHVDLMKVNIEGSEYELFDRLVETGWLSRIRLVSVQFHEWVPAAHRRRRAIRRELARTHTEAWCYPWVWEYWVRSA